MKYDWIDQYLLDKPGVVKDFKKEWNWHRYLLNDKMFLAICLNEELQPQYITLKLKPEYGEKLRSEREDIIPGYYMNKKHWNSILVEGNVSDELMAELADESYDLIFKSLPKKIQAEINQNN